MRSRSASITGATGFVGWHVAEHLVEQGWSVRAVVRRGNRKPLPRGVTAVESELTVASLADAFAGADVVVHGAALIRARDEATFDAVNVDGTRAAATAARSAGARLVLVSSQAAGGPGTPEAPRREDDPPAPVNAYGRSKLRAERAVHETAGLAWTIVRPCAVYGPRDRGFLPLFKLARRGLFLIPSHAASAFTLVYIADLVRAIRLAMESDAAVGQTFFLGHEQPRTGVDVLRAIAAACNRRFTPRHLPEWLFGALAAFGDLSWKAGVQPLVDSGRLAELRAPGFVCTVDRARDILGFTATTRLEDGIVETARWYTRSRWL